jgi:ribonucleoside-diphosphate reductase alpha chain
MTERLPQTETAEDSMEGYVGPERKRMPTDRTGLTHRVAIGEPGAQSRGYITVNRNSDGSVGEVFIGGFGQYGSTMTGMMDSFAIMFSIALQFGAEFPMLARKFAHMNFPPHGPTDNPEIPRCHSIPDYIFKWIAHKFGSAELIEELHQIDNDLRKERE